MEKFISFGIPYLDRTMGGLFLGDNVVWVLEPGMYFDYYLESFFTVPNPIHCKKIYVSFDFPPQKIYARYQESLHPDDFILVDAFTFGKGKGDEFFQSFYKKDSLKSKPFRLLCIRDITNPDEFITTMSELQKEFQDGALCKYVFYSLTGMQELWGERDTLHFFTYTCPKLYELQALAYWPLVKEAHSKAFLATISDITQLVISLSFGKENSCAARFLKMDGRPSHLLNIKHFYNFQDNRVNFLEPAKPSEVVKKTATPGTPDAEKIHSALGSKNAIRIGGRIREYRLEKSVSQVELARTLHITPSALSQIENNQSSPSLHLFVDIARYFGKPLDAFFVDTHTATNSMRSNHKKKGRG